MSIRRTLSLAGITIIDTGGARSRRLYPITDHLGSTVAIADGTGHLVQGLAYADFGKRYSAGWAAVLTTSQAVAINTTLSDRGYTGQESLDAIGLDDYNARLYDPTLGRFLSVDPLIAHPGSTQSINPYSYVENNPLNKVDPTGEADLNGSCGGVASHLCDNGGSWQDEHSGQTGPDANSSRSGSTAGGGKSSKQGPKSANARTNPNLHNYTGQNIDSTGIEKTSASATKSSTDDSSSSHHKGKYLSDTVVTIKNATKSETKTIKDMLHKIEDTKRGETIFQLAVNSKLELTIHINNQQIDKGLLFGTKATIELDPNYHPKISTTAGVIRATTIRIVAHELGHAITGAVDDGPDAMHNVRENENPIVTHLHPPQPARTAYYCPPSGC